ncbi:gp16 family protein [Testudinibacter sp. P27/CKL/0425]
MTTKGYTKPKLTQLIHIAKSQQSMDEMTYRAMLERITGKTSCKQMTVIELNKVLREMEQKGFKVRSNGVLRGGRSKSPSTQNALVKHDIAHKIRAVWITMAKSGQVRDGSEQALNAWVRGVINPILAKQGKPMALNVASLEYEQGAIVLERLKKWQQRGAK